MFDVVIILSAQLAGRDVEKPARRRSAAISARMLQPPSANVTGWGAASGGGASPEATARRAALQAAQRVRFNHPLFGISWMFCMMCWRRGARRCRPPSGCIYGPRTLSKVRMSCKLGLVERASHSCWAVCIQSPHAQAMAEPVYVASRSPGMLVVVAVNVQSFLALTLRRQRQQSGSRCWQPAWPAPLPGSRSSRKARRPSRRRGSSAWRRRRCTAAVVVWWTTALWLRPLPALTAQPAPA